MTAEPASSIPARMPALYLGHGAPTLVDDATWVGELRAWAARLPRPRSILVVSAHWESAPLTIGATRPVPLVYDFHGFPANYYQERYDQPGAPELADRVRALVPDGEPLREAPDRGLDHGAYVPLTVMYPDAEIPVLQVSMPDLDPVRLFRLGRQLAPLRDEGVLIMGSGFMTHGLPYIESWDPAAPAPAWSRDFDAWAADSLARGDLDQLFNFRHRGPAARYAHPTADHFVPLFVTLGAATDPEAAPETAIEGYYLGLSKRSFEVG